MRSPGEAAGPRWATWSRTRSSTPSPSRRPSTGCPARWRSATRAWPIASASPPRAIASAGPRCWTSSGSFWSEPDPATLYTAAWSWDEPGRDILGPRLRDPAVGVDRVVAGAAGGGDAGDPAPALGALPGPAGGGRPPGRPARLLGQPGPPAHPGPARAPALHHSRGAAVGAGVGP